MSHERPAEPSRSRAAAAEAHYRRIFEAVPVGIYALSARGEFTEVNPAAERILGRAAVDLIGVHISEVLPPDELAHVLDLNRRLFRGEIGMVEAEFHVSRPDGERRLVHVRSSQILEGDRIVGTHGVATDVTDERARERVAHRSERLAAIGTLISGVAHELNNPLNAIRNFAQLMLMDARSEDDREALEVMRNEADRAARIVADLRGVASQTAGSESRMPIDLNELARHVVQLRQYAAGAREISVSLSLEDDLPPVQVNRAELEEALLNLLVNAEEAIHEARDERRIEIRTRRVDAGVQLEIENTGRGIAPDDISRIFDPFWTTKGPGEGAGLGLSLVHRILTDQGGDVHVRSEEGSGAVFTLNLPAAAEAGGRSAPPLLGDPLRPLRVLVVDDERALRGSIGQYLRRRGHTVDEAADGAAALRMMEDREAYDVILTDLRMPGIGGEELLTRLRAAGAGMERRAIVITGHADEAEQARIIAATSVPILIKPVSLEEIAETVERQAELARDPDTG